MAERAVAPIVGVTMMVLITVVLAALVGGMVFGVELDDPPEASIAADATYNGTSGQTYVELTHLAGDTLDVGALTIRLSVDGERLEHQPPVPFFSATGFESGPTGPFNSGASETTWEGGERAGLTIAGSNDPVPQSGAEVTIRLFAEGYSVGTVQTTVR
ncbi:type IV pilin [Halobacteriales archaeon QS_3_64_16]|nr:MAG: type IV pilin [Halobacteriales archaeon QS_3_64_16]